MIRSIGTTRLVVDLVVAALFFAICLVPAVGQSAVDVVVLGILSIALGLRRLAPGIALVVAWAGAIVQMLALRDVSPADTAILGVLYATASYGSRSVRWIGLASAIAGAIVATTYVVFVHPFSRPASDAANWLQVLFFGVAFLAVLGLSWTLGLLARTARTARENRITARIEAERAAYEVAVEQERTRIARDMHDVVAHSLAVVIAQADGARYAGASDPTAPGRALGTIATTARAALGEVRLLLAELRHDGPDAPQPVFDDVGALVERMAGAGLHVDVRSTGRPVPLGAGAQIAAYRIVQEALTNALRHGDPTQPVTLAFDWSDDALLIRVENAVDRASTGHVGHGIPGMQERAHLVGGTLAAEALDGRFVVDARLPAAIGGLA